MLYFIYSKYSGPFIKLTKHVHITNNNEVYLKVLEKKVTWKKKKNKKS